MKILNIPQIKMILLNWNTRQKSSKCYCVLFFFANFTLLWNDGKPKWWEIYACINLSLVGISDWPAMSYENCSQVGELRKLLLQTNNKKHSRFRKKMVYQKIVRNIHNYKIQILTYVKVAQVTKRFFCSIDSLFFFMCWIPGN